jgi:branched-chain amino acid transport system substrate-binding protein
MRATALLAALLLLLTACAGDDTAPDATADDPITDTADDGTTDEDAADGEAGDDVAAGDCTLSDPVQVGVVFSLTGGAAVFGEEQANGVRLAAQQLNDQGGITYEVIQEDDASDPAQGITAFEKLLNQDDVSIIIGPTLSNTAFSTDPIAQEQGVPVLGVSNTAPGITDMGDFVFRNSLSEPQVIPQTIDAAQERLGLERVAIMYGDDDAFTSTAYDVFVEALDDNGIEVLSTQTFAKGDTDFAPQLTQIQGTDADALILSALAEEASLVLTTMEDLGLDIPVIGGNGLNSPAIIEQAGEAADGVIVGAAWNSASDIPANADFISSYEEEFGSSPDQFAAQAYAGMNLVAAAVQQACSADPAEIRDAMAGLQDVDTVLGAFSFQDNRDADHEAVVQIVEGGAFTILE